MKINDNWIKKINYQNRDDFQKAYLNEFPKITLLNWLEDFCNQLDCPPPEPPTKIEYRDDIEYFKKQGSWETKMFILQKLKYAIKAEKMLQGK